MRWGRLDIAGAVLGTAGISALSYGLIAAVDHPWSAVTVLLPIASGATLLAGLMAVEAKTPDPLVPLAFFSSPRRSAALLAVLLTAAGSATSFFFLTLYFQQVRGLSPLATSTAFLPYGLVVPTGLLAGRLIGRVGARPVTSAGLAVAAAGLLLLSRMGVVTPYAGATLLGLLLFPIGAGLAFSGATVAAVDGVPDSQAGVAAEVVNTAMETGPAVGLALFVSLAGVHTARLEAARFDPASARTGGYAFALSVAALAFGLAAGLAAVALKRAHESAVAQRDRTVGSASGMLD